MQKGLMRIPGAQAPIRSAVPAQTAVLGNLPKLADAAPVLITDAVLFRWARISRIANILPVMNEVRALEQRIIANTCKSCHKPVEIDRSAINAAKIALAECPDEIALLVKEAACVLKYKVVYRRLSEPAQEVTR